MDLTHGGETVRLCLDPEHGGSLVLDDVSNKEIFTNECSDEKGDFMDQEETDRDEELVFVLAEEVR